jgi:hypothetical protein
MKRRKTTTFVTFFNGFITKNGDGNHYCLFGGFVVKKVKAIMWSPSSVVVVVV